MRWLGWLWRREVAGCDEAVRGAERLRDRALEQQRRAAAIVPRVDAVTDPARHFSSMIENVLRSAK